MLSRTVIFGFLRRCALCAVTAAIVCAGAGGPALSQVTQPPPGARSPLSPPETNRVQAEAFKRGYEAYYRGQYERAAGIWTQLADQGHVKSMNNLATMYVQGKGVDRNYPLANLYYRRAAAQNDARAAYNLGLAHEFGRGVAKSDAEALGWYRKAADRGLVEAMNAIAWVYATSPETGVRNGPEALRWAQAALQRRTSSTHLATLAAAKAELGDYKGAVEAIDQAIAFVKREVRASGLLVPGREQAGLLRGAARVDREAELRARRQQYMDERPSRD
ncbi:MAG: sel1 repeat family protein [Alphaproteobacteria bacterium]|nr:sel1 repeat family protein [Alphaproteobacteria bacterium]